MRYVEPIYRPGPTESDSYLLQVTFGCSHNKCTFCSFFKEKPFGVRPIEEIEEDLAMARKLYRFDPPVYLIDGNPTCLPMKKLRPILEAVRRTFPNSPHTNMYARVSDICRNFTVEDLRELKELNVKFLYIGLESGSDEVLASIRKGATQEQAMEAARRLNEAGIPFSMAVILGLGGKALSEEHVRETVKVLNEAQPTYVGLMALNPQTGTPLYEEIANGGFELPTWGDIVREERAIIEGLDFDRESMVFAGGFMPGDSGASAPIPQAKSQLLEALDGRRVVNGMLDEEITMNRPL